MLIGGAAPADWPLLTERAQQRGRMRRIGVEHDPGYEIRNAAKGLGELGVGSSGAVRSTVTGCWHT
jgi:hypothetical protein